MKSANPEVSIIIVNWNVQDYLRGCIDSIVANCKDLSYEIIVVDNASRDGSVAMLKNDYPWVKTIANEDNVGFARANNQGFRISAGRYQIFLNPDTMVYKDALQGMISHLRENPKVGLVGPKLLSEDGSIQSRPRELVTVWYLISKLLYLPRIIKRIKQKSFLNEARQVEVLYGACLAIPRAVFEDIGMFSENYFMYREDIDICRKILQKGYQIHWYPSSAILHYGGKSASQKADDPAFRYMRNQAYYEYYICLKTDKGKIYAKIWALLGAFFALRGYLMSLLKIKNPQKAIFFRNKFGILLKAAVERGKG